MKNPAETHGSASLNELTEYLRLPSERAARELARTLGIRRVAGGYPWLTIWARENIASPAREHWGDLIAPHLTGAELANVFGVPSQAARRLDRSKPDAGFSDPVELQSKPKLWPRAQVFAWAAGLPVPFNEILTSARTSRLLRSFSIVPRPVMCTVSGV